MVSFRAKDEDVRVKLYAASLKTMPRYRRQEKTSWGERKITVRKEDTVHPVIIAIGVVIAIVILFAVFINLDIERDD